MNEEICKLKDTDTLKSFTGDDGQYFKGEKYREAINEFRTAIKEIIALYEKLSDRAGDELLLLLNKTFGYRSFGEIQWRNIGMVKKWVENNWFRLYQIPNPQEHAILMQTANDYSMWFNECLAKVAKKTTFKPIYE